jgi:hypothetical protein
VSHECDPAHFLSSMPARLRTAGGFRLVYTRFVMPSADLEPDRPSVVLVCPIAPVVTKIAAGLDVMPPPQPAETVAA